MKVQQKRIDGEGRGFIKLLPEVEEDMWHVYNLLLPGDLLTAVCFRKVTKESNTGSVAATRIKLKLTLNVETVDFDRSSCQIRVKGKNCTENDFIKVGQYHTLELDLNRPFSIEKVCWDALYLQRVDEACDVGKNADVAALVMQAGLAHLCTITSHMTQVRAKIEINIPRKRLVSSSGHDKALIRFYEATAEAIVKHVDFKVVKCLIVASPGFLKEDFLKWLMVEAAKKDWQSLIDNKSKLLPCHSSSGFKHSLKEVLADPTVASKINNTKAFGEVKALDAFFDAMQHDPEKAYYGLAHVQRATAQKAVDTLLLSDGLFRSDDVKTRQMYVDLCADVRTHGGDVKIFSSLHVSGEQLQQISGVAALLRFPLPDLDDDEEDETTTTIVATVKAPAASAAAAATTAASIATAAAAAAARTKQPASDFKRVPQKDSVVDGFGGSAGGTSASATAVASALANKAAQLQSVYDAKNAKAGGASIAVGFADVANDDLYENSAATTTDAKSKSSDRKAPASATTATAADDGDDAAEADDTEYDGNYDFDDDAAPSAAASAALAAAVAVINSSATIGAKPVAIASTTSTADAKSKKK